jgi:lipid II:glycine glycyltransferase (peptidoglycan interpeptide bridge formation enzyme)
LQAIIEPKPIGNLLPTDIAFQTGFWGAVKSRQGCRALAFDFCSDGLEGDILVLEQSIGDGLSSAYIPMGPEQAPEEEAQGPLLESLSLAIAKRLNRPAVFLRWDVPWKCPFSGDSLGDAYRPESRVREMRMNFLTHTWKLRVATTDALPRTTVLLDLSLSPEELLARMNSKTRYNIRLAHRKGVRVHSSDLSMLPAFYDLYCQTAVRNRFIGCDFQHIADIFTPAVKNPGDVEPKLLVAMLGEKMLAGAVVLFSRRAAVYLYGASSNDNRNYMAPYAIQWQITRDAQSCGCEVYDMFGASPTNCDEHPLQGVTRFKMGFGGKLAYRMGCWDYPIDEKLYNAYRSKELTDMARSLR